ncbi:MAG: hypothetical protein RLZZ419_2047, partial [Pseudomonadota bacterium]
KRPLIANGHYSNKVRILKQVNLSRLHPRPERRGFALHMDKGRKFSTFITTCVAVVFYCQYSRYTLQLNKL